MRPFPWRFVARVVLGAALLAFGAGPASAAIPATISHQGVLTNAAGAPVSGPFTVVFRLFAAPTGGSALWTETQPITASNGIFSVVLGSVTPLTSLAFDAPYWLEVQVGAETLSPRQPITASPYAMRAGCIPGDRVTCYSGGAVLNIPMPCAPGIRMCNADGMSWSSCIGEVAPNCGGSTCVSLTSDVNNCGSCGHVCPLLSGASSTTCTSGTCGVACNSGFGSCASPGSACDVNFNTDLGNCGGCGTICSSTNVVARFCSSGTCSATCNAGFVHCGTGNTGCECEGNACCGSGCQTKHNNGLGQFYFDCVALNTFTLNQALEAAAASTIGGTPAQATCTGPFNVVMNQGATQCGVWAYSGTPTGHVKLTAGACLCPTTSDPTWN